LRQSGPQAAKRFLRRSEIWIILPGRRPPTGAFFLTALLVCIFAATATEAPLAAELGELAVGYPLGFGELFQWDEPELSLFWSSFDEDIWWSVITFMAQEPAKERRAPVRVLHYMGTNFGLTGVETFILQLCAAQKRAGLTPSIVMELDGREEVRAISADLGIDVYDLPASRPIENRLPLKLGTAWLRARRIQALAQNLRDSDVLHIHAVGISCLDGFVAAGLSHTKALIVTHHGTMSWFAAHRNLLSDITFWIEKRWACRVVMPYAAAAAEFVTAGIPADRTSVIPFCVDEKLFSGLAPLPAPGELTLVMAARMHHGKGQAHLLAALAKLSPRYPKMRALFIGDGPTRPEVEAEIDRLGLRNAVTSMGRVDHREIPKLMQTAHVVVLPSYMKGEMFPLCLIEGMALGLPAIATRWSGIPEIVEDGETGILVEPRDEDALAQAIERYLEEPEFYARARRNALARFRSHYAATAVARAYSEHYEVALREQGSA
jgi:glycosyltransferase involved in cell wall biosynthesis